MSNRRRNLNRQIRAHDRNRKLRLAAVDPAISDRIAAIASRRAELDGYPGPGAINAYHCPDCRSTTVVVHVDAGVTPMFLACRATAGCHGRSVSTGYRLDPASLPKPTHEWYRPSGRELLALPPAMRIHIDQGGLALREVAQ